MIRRSPRRGFLRGAWLLFLASVVSLALLFAGLYALSVRHAPATPDAPLLVYCAAGVKQPIEAAAQEYEKVYGVPVHLEYGGSQTLLAKLEVNPRGDLFILADDHFVALARKKDLLAEAIPLAHMTPVIAVAKGNPRKIQSVDDLLKGDYTLSLANPDAAAVGKLTRDALQASGQWEALQKRSNQVSKPTVNDVANDVKLGAAGAGIVWDATVKQMPDLDAVADPQLAKKKAQMSAGVLKASAQPTAALRFARFLAARDRGQLEVKKAGFEPIDGDKWEVAPEMTLYAGAMLRPAVAETIAEFEKREGVKVITKYNGCGILVGDMRAGVPPDAYFACDTSFMKQVHDLFLEPIDISSNQLVIVVHKGNPKNLRSLKDLGTPGLQIGVGHEQQCALGAITQQTLAEAGLRDPVNKNIAVRSPAGDLLINQLRAAPTSLDAVIAYISNTAGLSDIEAYTVEGIPCATVIQPIAVGKDSKHKQLASRLMDAIRSRESQDRFAAYGFGWEQEKIKPGAKGSK